MKNQPIVHIEIPAANRQVAAKFYADMFGWEMQHMEQPAPYTLFKSGNVAGGFPDVDDTYKPGDVVIYVDSDNIEADLKRIAAAGGKALGAPMVVQGMGTFAFFADPTGNRLALWKADMPSA
jgi:uncharacterized protein